MREWKGIKGSGEVVYIEMIGVEARSNGLFLLIIVLHAWGEHRCMVFIYIIILYEHNVHLNYEL